MAIAIFPPQGRAIQGKQSCEIKKSVVSKESLSRWIQLCLKPITPTHYIPLCFRSDVSFCL